MGTGLPETGMSLEIHFSQTGKKLLIMINTDVDWIYNSDLNVKETALHCNIVVVFIWHFLGPDSPKDKYLLLLLIKRKGSLSENRRDLHIWR